MVFRAALINFMKYMKEFPTYPGRSTLTCPTYPGSEWHYNQTSYLPVGKWNKPEKYFKQSGSRNLNENIGWSRDFQKKTARIGGLCDTPRNVGIIKTISTWRKKNTINCACIFVYINTDTWLSLQPRSSAKDAMARIMVPKVTDMVLEQGPSRIPENESTIW